MPIQPFDQETAVAFLDISGFKHLMRNRDKAMQVLSQFYELGFSTLKRHQPREGSKVEGLFVTDCGILFVRHANETPAAVMQTLLAAVEDLNRGLLRRDIKVTTSIAFGFFSYHPLTEYDGVEKNFIFGSAYVNAYQDSVAHPKLEPGMCRVLLENFDLNLKSPPLLKNPIWTRCRRKEKHIYFYWMCENPAAIEGIARGYEQANLSRFKMIDTMLQRCSRTWGHGTDRAQ